MGVFALTRLGTAIVLLAVVMAGCSRGPATGTDTGTASGDRKVFQVRGVVKELRFADKEIVIKHEEIPSYMQAMTMPFEVRNMNEFTGLSTNDQVSFTMIVTEKDGWIENIKKIGIDTNSVAPPKERPATRVVRDVDPLSVGDKMPDYAFTNSFGKVIHLDDFKGQAYAFTFIFTRCPFPTFCPRMSSNFSDAYKQLMENTNVQNWHLLSISFDPDFDTPERLANYSSMYKPDLKKWDWATGAMIEIDAITEQVGFAFAFENGTFTHNLRTVVVDRNGVLRKIFSGNEWKPEDLVREILAGAEGQPVAKEK